ncbi:hypothetical protein ACP4OV_012801 [Aristida adscensionis]
MASIEEIAAASMTRGFDLSLMDSRTLTLVQHVYSSLPTPPVTVAARLAPASASAARAPADGVDRISALPALLLRDVVSRLPAKDGARTAVLSRRWRRVWRATPLALVDAHLAPSAARASRRDAFLNADTKNVFAAHRNLAAPVSRALAAHPGPFRCVYLTRTAMDAHLAELHRWLQLLATKGVQELVLVNRGSNIDTDLRLPGTLFSAPPSPASTSASGGSRTPPPSRAPRSPTSGSLASAQSSWMSVTWPSCLTNAPSWRSFFWSGAGGRCASASRATACDV